MNFPWLQFIGRYRDNPGGLPRCPRCCSVMSDESNASETGSHVYNCQHCPTRLLTWEGGSLTLVWKDGWWVPEQID